MERGIPLPPLGSFQFQLLSAGLERDRAQRFAFAQFLAVFLEPISGMPHEDSIKALADYGEELHQLTYNYEYERIRERLERVRVDRKLEELRILDKVSQFTVED